MVNTGIERIECRICYTIPDKQTFIDCGECRKKVCTDCFSRLERLQCPYCRNNYHNNNYNNDYDDNYDDNYDDDKVDVDENLEVDMFHEMSFDDAMEPWIRLLQRTSVVEEIKNSDVKENVVPNRLIQEFQENLHHYVRRSIRNLTYESVESFLCEEIDSSDLIEVLAYARQQYQIYRRPE